MPTGLTGGAVNAPTDLPSFGEIQWEDSPAAAGYDARSMVGGPTWGEDMMGFNPSTGFNRISTGEDVAPPIPAQGIVDRTTDWRMALNPHSPTLWVMVFALAAVGFIHARLQVRGGPVGGGVAIGR